MAQTEYDLQLNKASPGAKMPANESTKMAPFIIHYWSRSTLLTTVVLQSRSLPFIICGRELLPFTNKD